VSSHSSRIFTCDRCEHQICKIEVDISQESLERFSPKYCPYSSRYATWSENNGGIDDGSGGLVPKNVKHKIRNTGKMWVVETVLFFGNKFSSRKNVKYFYNKDLAEKEYEKRSKGDGRKR